LTAACASAATACSSPEHKKKIRPKSIGLNRNYNRRLKNIFKGAATTVITQRLEPMVSDYHRCLEQGTKPLMAKLTLARRISATVLAMWKNKEAYHPERYRPTP
jgi:hypothetical protein